MTTLVIGTAGALAVVLVLGLLFVVGFLMEIRRLMKDTALALDDVEAGTVRVTGRLERVQQSTTAAAGELPSGRA